MTRSDMSDQAFTTLSLRLPVILREKIQTQAANEERTESGFVRYHIGKVVNATEEETTIEEESAS